MSEQQVISIVGWVLWSAVAVFALQGLIYQAQAASRGRAVTRPGLFQFAAAMTLAIAFLATDWNKLHLAWLIPAAWVLSFTRVGAGVGWVVGAVFGLLFARSVREQQISSGAANTDVGMKPAPGRSSDDTLQITGNMPDVTIREPSRVYRAENYLIFFVADVPTVAERATRRRMPVRCRFVLYAVDSRTKAPAMFVTLEESVTPDAIRGEFEREFGADLSKAQTSGRYFLCTLKDGLHSNLGSDPDCRNEGYFVTKGLQIIVKSLGITADVERLK